jgi:hypothetical protein
MTNTALDETQETLWRQQNGLPERSSTTPNTEQPMEMEDPPTEQQDDETHVWGIPPPSLQGEQQESEEEFQC